jgi:hypothetical protein
MAPFAAARVPASLVGTLDDMPDDAQIAANEQARAVASLHGNHGSSGIR